MSASESEDKNLVAFIQNYLKVGYTFKQIDASLYYVLNLSPAHRVSCFA